MAFRTRDVVGASVARWAMATRLAGVKCTLPSAVSALGETVAALAVHMGEADMMVLSSGGAACHAALIISCGEPEKQSRVSVARGGGSWGGRMPCVKPSRIRVRIFSRPWSAALRGEERRPAWLADAMLPHDSPV